MVKNQARDRYGRWVRRAIEVTREHKLENTPVVNNCGQGLSPDHIVRHVTEFTKKWLGKNGNGGGHGGLSANVLCAILQEPPEKLVPILAENFNPLNCYITYVPIWYISKTGMNGFLDGEVERETFPKRKQGDPFTKADCSTLAIAYANKWPGKGIMKGQPSDKELPRVLKAIGVNCAEAQMTDETCIFCVRKTEN